MAEPLVGHQALVADCQPLAGLATVHAEPAGPAGSAGLDLGAGLELDIDVAHPAVLAGLTIELPALGDIGVLPPAVRPRLDALLGPGRLATLASIAREGADTRARVQRRLDGDAGERGSSSSQQDPGVPRRYGARRGGAADGRGRGRSVNGAGPTAASVGVSPALYRSALAHGAAYQPGAPPVVGAVGLLDAAASLTRLAGRLNMQRAAVHDARVGTDLLLDLVADDLVKVPDQRTAAGLASVVRQASRLLDGQPSAARRMIGLADELDRGDHTRDPALVTSPDDPSPDVLRSASTSVLRRVSVPVGSLPGALAEAAVTGCITGPSEVEVRIDGWADRRSGLWARAFDARDDTLLAVAPFLAGAGDAIAHLIVAPEAIRQLEVDVTDRPEMPRPSPALAAVQRAIHLGMIAARAERLGSSQQAADWWRRCARAWGPAGDRARAEQARMYADHALTSDPDPLGRIVRPLISDLICSTEPAPTTSEGSG